MSVRRVTSLLFAVCIFAALSSPSRANQILNGGFESPVVLAGSFLDINPGDEAADGFLNWTVTTGNIDIVNTSQPLFNINWGAQASIDGSQILDLNGYTEGGITQSFSTIAGQQYVVQFWYANNPVGTGGSAQVGIADVGTTNNSLLSASIAHNSSTLTTPDWQLYSGAFTAQGTLTNITIVSTSNPDNASGGVVLDAVSVAVPEPATMILGGCGLLALVVVGWRRSRAMRA